MKIETEFEPAQKVWFMRNNKCEKLPIIQIDLSVRGNCMPTIYYCFQTEDGIVSVYEGKVFATKEELIASL